MNSYMRDFNDWYSTLRQACGQIEATPSDDQSLFVGHVLRQNLAGLDFTRIRTNVGHIVCRGLRHCTKSDLLDDSNCFLVVQQSGRSRLTQSGVSIDLVPGDVAYMDASEDCEILPHGLM